MSTIINGSSPSVTFSDSTTQTTATPDPTTTGNIPFTTNGTSWSSVAKIVSGTATASTSGTSIDFTGIPSWVKRITVMFNAVSTNGTSQTQIQLGSGSVTTTGYNTVASYGTGATQYGSSTSGFITETTAITGAVAVRYGQMIFSLVSSNVWVAQGNFLTTASAVTVVAAGQISLSGVLDRVRITTVNGTDTFDAGSINILYE